MTFRTTDNRGTQNALLLYEEITKGRTPPKYINKFGYNPVVSTTEETVFFDGGTKTIETVSFNATIVSNDNADTGDILIVGIDANYDWQAIMQTMTGTTPINLSEDWIDIFRLKWNSAGTNVDRVDIYETGDATNIKCSMPPARGSSLCAQMTIPRGYLGVLHKYRFTSTADNMQGRIYKTEFGKGPRMITQDTCSAGVIPWDYGDFPEIFEPKSVIEMRAQQITGGANGEVEGRFTMELKKL